MKVMYLSLSEYILINKETLSIQINKTIILLIFNNYIFINIKNHSDIYYL